MKTKKKILIIGLFSRNTHSRKYITAPEQLADLFEKNNVAVIKTAYSIYKLPRLIHIVKTILTKRNDFDIAIAPLYGSSRSFYLQVITSRLLKMLNKKILMTVHGGSIPERMQEDPSRFLHSLKRAYKIVTPSRFLQHELSQYNLSATVIGNVLPIKQYPFQSKKKFRPKVLWMRTFEDIYNPSMAIDVASLLAEKYEDFEMVMAGADRGLLAPTKKYAQEKGLADKVSFPGFISDEQKINYAHDFDFFISTNNIDNAPVSLVEVMALGLPVISTNAGGIPYIIEHDHNGCLVNMKDAAAMAKRIIDLIEAPEQAQKITCAARKYAEQYDEEVVMEKWRNLLAEEVDVAEKALQIPPSSR